MFRDTLASGLASLGIRPGDTVLMHSSMKALGIRETPEEFLCALSDYLGSGGTLLLPSLSYDTVTADSPLFSVKDTPACIGLLPNVFLHMDGVLRSLHPTHSCAAKGRLAKELTDGHILDETPVGPHSPFRKLPAVGGKILMVGDINDHCTFMHGMEEIAEVPYLLAKTKTRYIIRDEKGVDHEVLQYRHDTRTVTQRYGRFEKVLSAPDVLRGKLFEANCTCIFTPALEKAAVAKMREDPYFFVDRR